MLQSLDNRIKEMELFNTRLSGLVLSALFLLLQVTPTMAGYSRFDKATFSVSMPCVAVVPSQPGADIQYRQMTLAFHSGQFHVSSVTELDVAGECFASYDEESGVLTDQLWHKDKIFDVTLVSVDGISFDLDGLDFREKSRTSLWRVSDGVNEVIIGGTIHILHEDDFPLPEVYSTALSEADILVTEISQEDFERGLEEAAPLLINPDGLLSDILMPASLGEMENYLAEFNYPLALVDPLRPYWAGQQLIQLKLVSLGYGDGVDVFFQNEAAVLNKSNIGLESVESQLALLNEINEEESADEIIFSAIDAAESDEYFDMLDFLIDSWREGDMEYFVFLNNQQKLEDEISFERVFIERNMAWIPQIENMFLTEEVELVLVGAGHLAGDDNVLALLEELGYTVERY